MRAYVRYSYEDSTIHCTGPTHVTESRDVYDSGQACIFPYMHGDQGARARTLSETAIIILDPRSSSEICNCSPVNQ